MGSQLEELIKAGCIYIYEILSTYGCEAVGIVVAESREAAREKVRSSYLKHGYDESELEKIMIEKTTGRWFSDSPDVLEVIG